jgi:hypothetical protein
LDHLPHGGVARLAALVLAGAQAMDGAEHPMNPTLQFFAHLHRGGAYAYYHALPERRSWWYPVGNVPALPETGGTNWYFNVHPTTMIPLSNARGEPRLPMYVRSQKRYIAAVNCLFAEFDVKDYGDKASIMQHLRGLPVPYPSILIDSGGGMHAYWLLRQPFMIDCDDQREAARIIQYLWVDTVQGDPGAKDLTRVLRLPGSLNHKYDPPRPVVYLACDLERSYPLQVLTAHLPAVRESLPRLRPEPRRVSSIDEYNRVTDIGMLLEHYGYIWRGRYKMLSPYSTTGEPGVTIDLDSNRAFVHHSSDPMYDGYWKRPFDVLKILEYGGDFQDSLTAIRRGIG